MIKHIINTEIHTVTNGIIKNGFVEITGGKISRIGNMSEYELCGEEVFDAGGLLLFPGFIDAHCHLGIFGDSLRLEGWDGNEATDPVTPQLRAADGINVHDRYFSQALRAGVTAVGCGPGSANPVGGQVAVLKTQGGSIDDMLVKQYAAMKFALGENPKLTYNDRKTAPTTRMANASIIREALIKAREYGEKRQKNADTDYNAKYEALLPLLSREIKAHFHAHRADDICTAVRIAGEFGLDYVIVHCTDGALVLDKLAERSAQAFVGPIICDRSKPELYNLDPSLAAKLAERNIFFSITTDHPVVPIQYLSLSAMIAVKSGLSRESALEAITINPAKLLGVSDRIGSIETGKDADLLLLDGDPLDMYTKVVRVMVDGEFAG